MQLQRWGEPELRVLWTKLSDHLPTQANQHIQALLTRLQDKPMKFWVSDAIYLLSEASSQGLDADQSLHSLLCAVDWSYRLVVPGTEELQKLSSLWMTRFWTYRFLSVCDENWIAPTREGALTTISALNDEDGLAPVSPEELFRLIQNVGEERTQKKRQALTEQALKRISLPCPEDILSGLISAELLHLEGDLLLPESRERAVRCVGVGLLGQEERVAAEPVHSHGSVWSKVLEILGEAGGDPTPFLRAFEAATPATSTAMALPLVRLLTVSSLSGPERYQQLLRRLQATAIMEHFRLIAAIRFSLQVSTDGVNERSILLRRFSRDHCGVLGWVHPSEMLSELERRLPASLRAFSRKSRRKVESQKQDPFFRLTAAARPYGAVLLAPFQAPPLDAEGLEFWRLAQRQAGGLGIWEKTSLPELMLVAATAGHEPARLVLSGLDPAQPTQTSEFEVALGDEEPQRIQAAFNNTESPWSLLSLEVQVAWLGRVETS